MAKSTENIVAQYEAAQDNSFVIPTENFRITTVGEGIESSDNTHNWYADNVLEHLDTEPDYYRTYFNDCITILKSNSFSSGYPDVSGSTRQAWLGRNFPKAGGKV